MGRKQKINLFNYEEVRQSKKDNETAETKSIDTSKKIQKMIGMSLDSLVQELERLIVADQLIRTDTFYNIAWDRGYKIKKAMFKENFLEIQLPPISESEKILRAYEENKDIKPLDFLLLELPEVTKDTLKRTIDNNKEITSFELLEKFSIFEYPHYFAFAFAKTEKELLNILDLLKKFDKISKSKLIDTNDKMFNNLSASRKRRRKKEITPGCFDGLCIEKNIKATPLFSRETNF